MILFALLGSAWAGLGVKTSREPLPSREIEKSVVLPKGWTELDLAVDAARANDAWDAEGEAVPLDVPWRTRTVTLGLRAGIAPGFEVFGRIPWREARSFVTQRGFGTSEVGVRFALERSEAPFHSVGLEVAARAPLGFDGGSLDGEGKIPLTTGTGDLQIAVDARRAVEGVLLRGRVAGMRRFAGRVGWRDGRMKPGDRVWVGTEVLVQAGPLGFGPNIEAGARGPVRTAEPDGLLFPVQGSAGAWVDLGGRMLLHLTRGVEVEGRLRWAMVGEDDTFVRLDELHPARSRTAGLSARVRW